MDSNTPTTPSPASSTPTIPTPPSDPIFEAIQGIFVLFHDKKGHAYANYTINGLKETLSIRGRKFRQIVRKKLYEMNGKIPSTDTVKNMAAMMEIIALEGEEDQVFRRIASIEGATYIDLCNKAGEHVKITRFGYEIILSIHSPVNFLKTPRQQELPRPVANGQLGGLANFFHLESSDDLILIIAWMVMALNPNGPYPLLVVQGPQGSGKTNISKFACELIDPAFPSIESFPSSERDFLVCANNAHVMPFDNISTVSDRMSDVLCRICTGGGRSTRELYSNGGVHSIDSKNPVILNSITDPLTRPDACERSLNIKTAIIPPEKRLPEEELRRKWDELKPGFLGALYNAVSMAMRNMDTVKLASYPRMADFAKFIVAAEPALPWDSGIFLKAYENNRMQIIDNAIEADPVATAVQKLIQACGQWTGTPSDLLSTLNQYTSPEIRRLNIWPKMPNSLSGKLSRCATFLRAQNIVIISGKAAGQRFVSIFPTQPPPQPPPAIPTYIEE